MNDERSPIEASYDAVASEYAVEFADELARKPFDREVLDRFAEDLRGRGVVCEVGCGPGHVARYLKDRGLDMRGIDISVEMVRAASRLHPDIPFERGDMVHLDLPEGSLAGIVCFYAIIHVPREDVPRALSGMHRTLAPGGEILLSFHGGAGMIHRDQWYDKAVSVDVTLFGRDEMAALLGAADFEGIDIQERAPYDFEYQTRRLYARARKKKSG